MSHLANIPPLALELILATLIGSFLIAGIRLWRGPTLPDRVIALDLMTVLSLGALATYAIIEDEAIYIDVAIVLSLITFLATIAFARYVEKRSEPQEDTT